MTSSAAPRFRGQRCQSLVEFALIAPVLLLLLLGIVDFGRVIYAYVTLTQAVNEGARVAIRDSAIRPSNATVEAAVQAHASGVVLANPCPNGPLDSAQTPPPNVGWVFITEPDPPSSPESLASLVASDTFNAPGGQASGALSGSCSAINPAAGHVPLQVTIWYQFVPATPMISGITGPIVIKTATTYRTEY